MSRHYVHGLILTISTDEMENSKLYTDSKQSKKKAKITKLFSKTSSVANIFNQHSSAFITEIQHAHNQLHTTSSKS